jgi:hypothetical protein
MLSAGSVCLVPVPLKALTWAYTRRWPGDRHLDNRTPVQSWPNCGAGTKENIRSGDGWQSKAPYRINLLGDCRRRCTRVRGRRCDGPRHSGYRMQRVPMDGHGPSSRSSHRCAASDVIGRRPTYSLLARSLPMARPRRSENRFGSERPCAGRINHSQLWVPPSVASAGLRSGV